MTKMEVDPYDQAIKALAQRCPFDIAEELASHASSLPFRLARMHSKNHHKLKKPPGEFQTVDTSVATAAAKHGKGSAFWEQAEVYFRPIDESDIEFLRHRRLDETLFFIPSLKDSNFNEVFDAESATSIITTEALSVKEEVTEEVIKNRSINWLLGSKHRAILASERPNKKRKLLGSAAGLDQLLALNDSKESKIGCDVCCLGENGGNSDDIVTCTLCNVPVHKKCYGLHEKFANGSFLCSWCNHLDSKASLKPCLLCPKEGGALKIVSGDGRINGKFVHLFCSIWTPEVFVEDLNKMEPVLNVGGVEEKRMSMVCTLCKIKHGACVRCSYGSCRAAFHPICARDARHRMEIWGKFGCDNVELRVFCSKHSTADDAQSNAENVPHAKPNNIIKLKLSCNNKGREKLSEEKSKLVENEVTLEEDALVINSTITLEEDALVINPTMENDVFPCKNMCKEVIEGDNTSPDVSDLIVLVKTLIGDGKIVVSDAAAEIGISCATLEAVLSGNISSFSPELGVKFTKWVQKLSQECITMQQMKFRKGYSISTLTDAINSGFSRSFRSASSNDTDDSVKLLPVKMLDDQITRFVGEHERKDTKNELVDESSEITGCPINDKNQTTAGGRIFPCQDQREDQTSLEMITEGSCITQTLCPQAFPHVVEGSYPTVENNLLRAEQIQCTVEVVSSNKSLNENHTLETSGLDISKSERIYGSSPASYPHPYIQTRLMQMQGLPVHQESIKYQTEAEVLPTKSSGISEQLLSSFDLDQLANAKKLGILDCSVEDELEGEIVYQQKKLLDNADTIKHGFDDLFGKMMKKLPQEIIDFKKREWDLVTVSQFLCEDNDTKKRGRKGRKRREFPLEVETDPAMPSTSSRHLEIKAEDGVSPNTENPQTLLPIRSTRGLRLRDTERTSISKSSHSITADENLVLCDICSRPETLLNRMFICSVCKVAVHLDCYCKLTDPIGLWKCNVCENALESGTPQSPVECVLCGGGKGAFRKSTEGRWVHAFCAEWLLEATYRRGQQNLVEGVDDEVSKGKNTHTCNVCKQKNGVCLMCNFEHCQATFHPTCAKAAGYFMDVKIVGGSFHHKSYCDRHSVQQRQKAEDQQYSDDEFKSIKQMRFELEKLRILCERIVRREKIKKELVICSHAVLASKKDCLAVTMSVSKQGRRPTCVLSASSESATTSIDNKSYSGTGTVQRSEDVTTVASTVSSKSRSRISFETDGKNDETSTSKPMLKRKMTDRNSYSGKQLPHRIKVLSFQCSGDGGKKLNAIKNMDIFNKVIFMTSDQASAHNKLEKGFVYVPISPLSEVKPIEHGPPSHESEEPGG